LFIEWIHWMIWFQMGTLCDLSLSWIHLMVLEFVVKTFEWHPKLNVLWVFKWKPRVWVVGFGLVDSLALVPFNLHISFHLFYLVFYSWINPQTFGTRLKWGWLNKTPTFDHFPVDSTSHLHTHYIANDSCACEYSLKHTSATPIYYNHKQNHQVHQIHICSWSVSQPSVITILSLEWPQTKLIQLNSHITLYHQYS